MRGSSESGLGITDVQPDEARTLQRARCLDHFFVQTVTIAPDHDQAPVRDGDNRPEGVGRDDPGGIEVPPIAAEPGSLTRVKGETGSG